MISTDIIKLVLKDTDFTDYHISYVNEGVSTDVFKLTKENKTFYLRILPDYLNIENEVLAHKLMLEKHIKVPQIYFYKTLVKELDNRSFMIVSEIKGTSLINSKNLTFQQKKLVSINAGSDIAKINSIKVKGVGWLDKNDWKVLIAKGSNYHDFVLKNLENMLNDLVNLKTLNKTDSDKINSYVIKNKDLFDTVNESFLAHGDFSVDHVYQYNNEYSGIIDFGDTRGTTKYHDLSHIYTYNKEYFDDFVEGYNQVYKLPLDYLIRVQAEAVLFGVGKLWFIAKNNPKKLIGHKVYDLFKDLLAR